MATDKITLQRSEDMGNEFADLVAKCYRENPNKEDLKDLRKYLDKNPRLYHYIFDMTDAVRSKMIENFVPQDTPQLAIKTNIKFMRQELGYERVPMIEKILIDNIVNCWFRLQWVEYQLAAFMGESEVRFSEIEYWEKRVSATQRRYLRACETLARVRKLTRNTPTLQVNIATEKGQQVNIAGDIVKKDDLD